MYFSNHFGQEAEQQQFNGLSRVFIDILELAFRALA